MKRLLFILFLVVCGFGLHAQELKCTVNINSDQIEGSNKEVFNTLKQSIEEYVNALRWTNMTFQEKERIECSMLLVVKSVQDDVYTCEFTCQSRRPVFGTTYYSPTLNFQDKNFVFTYQE